MAEEGQQVGRVGEQLVAAHVPRPRVPPGDQEPAAGG